jgi:hypothetical protein
VSGFHSLGWDLAAIVMPSVVVGAFLLAALLTGAGVWYERGGEGRYDRDGFGFYLPAILLAVAGTVVLVITLVGAVPFQSRYWTWYEVPAHIESVSNTIRDADGDLTTQPVVEVPGLDRPVVVNDPRIVTLVGQDITLACKPSWHYHAADTYSCRIYDLGGAA